MKIFKIIGTILLVIISLIVNVIELVMIVISYALYGLGYVLYKVFKPVAEWLVEFLKKFNFLTILQK